MRVLFANAIVMRFLSIFTLSALCACAAQPALLNSERIQQRYGSYGIEVLSQRSGVRHSNLFSIHGGEKICRTYAIVEFAKEIPDPIAKPHAQIVAGDSIGATFKAYGWNIDKATVHIGTVPLNSSEHPIARLMHLEKPDNLAVHVYQFTLRRDGQSIQYATIAELHHPDYLTVTQLHSVYKLDDASSAGDEVEKISTLISNMD